jgi:hypothetical protein
MSESSTSRRPAAPEQTGDPDTFDPVPVRYRHDGWTPDRQVEFIRALAATGCVDQACAAVRMSRASAYALRQRADAEAFRLAWEAASDAVVPLLSDAAMSRSIHGVPVPIFWQGQQIGERRHFDERLTMFMLRYRAPTRYGRWLDRVETRQRPDGPVLILAYRIGRMARAAWRNFDAALRGQPMPEPEPEPLGWDGGEADANS